MQETPFPL